MVFLTFFRESLTFSADGSGLSRNKRFRLGREMLRLLGNMTNNLNQIAKRLNARGNLYETEIEEIQQKQDELWKMMRQLLSILERTG